MSDYDKGKQPAFPSDGNISGWKGMDYHFYATCEAVKGILSNSYFNEARNETRWHVESIVKRARAIADEIIKQENEKS